MNTGNNYVQNLETHTAYCFGSKYTVWQSLNDKITNIIVYEAMCLVFHSMFAACIVSRRNKTCEFLGFVWDWLVRFIIILCNQLSGEYSYIFDNDEYHVCGRKMAFFGKAQGEINH